MDWVHFLPFAATFVVACVLSQFVDPERRTRVVYVFAISITARQVWNTFACVPKVLGFTCALVYHGPGILSSLSKSFARCSSEWLGFECTWEATWKAAMETMADILDTSRVHECAPVLQVLTVDAFVLTTCFLMPDIVANLCISTGNLAKTWLTYVCILFRPVLTCSCSEVTLSQMLACLRWMYLILVWLFKTALVLVNRLGTSIAQLLPRVVQPGDDQLQIAGHGAAGQQLTITDPNPFIPDSDLLPVAERPWAWWNPNPFIPDNDLLPVAERPWVWWNPDPFAPVEEILAPHARQRYARQQCQIARGPIPPAPRALEVENCMAPPVATNRVGPVMRVFFHDILASAKKRSHVDMQPHDADDGGAPGPSKRLKDHS
jgi:hypothetical protein